MLWILRPLHSFALVAAVQHLMGLAMGVLIYLLARRFGLPAWAATLATLPVLFDAYELQLESDALPDVPFGFLVVLALYLLLRSPGERRPARYGGRCLPARGVGAALAGGAGATRGAAGGTADRAADPAGGPGDRASRAAGRGAAGRGVRRLVQHSPAAVQPDQERRGVPVVADDVVRGLRGDQAAGRRAGAVPAAGTADGSRRRCTSGTAIRRCWRCPAGGSRRGPTTALHFALRAIAAQPGDYAAAVAHDFSLSFFWDRPVHPDAGIVDRYQFADAATAWVPAGCAPRAAGRWPATRPRTTTGRPAPTRVVQPYASWLVQLPAVRLPARDAARGDPAGRAGRDGRATAGRRRDAVGVRGDDPAGAAAGRRLRPALPGAPVPDLACLAAALASPRACGPAQRVDDVAGGHRDLGIPDERRTSSLPSESTPTAGPESA